MFTGLVTGIGTVRRTEASGEGLELELSCPWDDLAAGESVAVDGACLTVTRADSGRFTCHVVVTTLARTRFADLAPGDRVNLERALRAGDRLGGHLVQGHVDVVGTIVDAAPDLRITMPADLLRYVVEKGSIAVDGVSLTVAGVGPGWFSVALVPHTLEVTTLGDRRPGDPVQLEVDVVAKYVERLVNR